MMSLSGSVLRLGVILLVGLGISLGQPEGALAQSGEGTADAPQVPQEITPMEEVEAPSVPSPLGAFGRSLLLPGWGHLATGSPLRGAFYFGATSLNTYMLVKTRHRQIVAADGETMQREAAEARYLDQGITDPDSLQAAIDADPKVVEAESLVVARGQQMEDWVAWTLFMLLLGGADAYVSSHLADFPEPLTVDVNTNGPGEPLELGFSWAWAGPGG